jgi:hypothetical protein
VKRLVVAGFVVLAVAGCGGQRMVPAPGSTTYSPVSDPAVTCTFEGADGLMYTFDTDEAWCAAQPGHSFTVIGNQPAQPWGAAGR